MEVLQSPENLNPKCVMPNFYSEVEVGELKRVANLFDPDSPERFISKFYKSIQSASIADLTEKDLRQIDNTDALSVVKGNFDMIEYHLNEYKKRIPDHIRDWNYLRGKMLANEELDMPVIIYFKRRYHLMSGNTRLMVSRVLGIIPKVVLITMD